VQEPEDKVTVKRGWAIAVILLACATACGRVHPVQPWKVPVQVELDVFSGRSNPSWELTGQQSVEFLQRLRALQPAQSASPPFDGLGYRGFEIKAQGQSINGFDEVRVFRGEVLAIGKDASKVFSDPQHSLELWLLETGSRQVNAETAGYVKREIGPQ
jgi:hypothetical protein